jgi:hypothetical protein
MLSAAVLTGLLYARFALPKSSFMFSDCICISKFNGRDALTFRVTNHRQSEIKDVHVKVFAMVRKENWTSLVSLHLEKKFMPELGMFPWTLVHPIDANSPLAVEHWEDVNVQQILVHISGVDVIVNTVMYDSKSYKIENVRLNHKLRDLISYETIELEDGQRGRKQLVNLKHFHHTVSSPSERFESYSTYGGAAAMMDVVTERVNMLSPVAEPEI